MKSNLKFRSKCPISCVLDIFGDKWSLLIIRDMIFFQKKTFKDFFSSKEKIASNILSSRLKNLEKMGAISKNNILNNKKIKVYKLTNSGLKLIPLFLEMTIWSNNNIQIFKDQSQKLELSVRLAMGWDDKFPSSIKDKQKYINNIEDRYLKSFKDIH